MFKGTKVELGGKEYVVPSLTLDQVEAFIADGTIDRVPQNGLTYIHVAESRQALVDVSHAALSRNYPNITREEIRAGLDLSSVSALVDAVMGASGLIVRAASGEARGP